MLDEIITRLDDDEETREFLENKVQENFDCDGQLDMTEDITLFVSGYVGITDYSDCATLCEVIKQNINDKTAAKMGLVPESEHEAREHQDYYNGSRNSASEHLLANYLGSSTEYNKTLSTSYQEYLMSQEQNEKGIIH